MKALRLMLIAALILSVLAVNAMAKETLYVTDTLKITVRSGPSTGNRVIATLSSGDTVTMLEKKKDGWGKVSLPDGKTGWLLHRYLIDKRPAVLVLRDMKPDKGQEELLALREESRDLKKYLAEATSEANTAKARYQQLKRDAGQALALRTELDQIKAAKAQQVKALQDTSSQQAARLRELETENESMRFSGGLKWFLSGAGVLLLGWIIGWMLGRRRSRTSSLY